MRVTQIGAADCYEDVRSQNFLVMIQKSLRPGVHLQKYIREYVLIHLDIDNSLKVPVKPYPANPEQGITFYINGFVTSIDPITCIAEKRPSTVIFGQPVQMQNLQAYPSIFDV